MLANRTLPSHRPLHNADANTEYLATTLVWPHLVVLSPLALYAIRAYAPRVLREGRSTRDGRGVWKDRKTRFWNPYATSCTAFEQGVIVAKESFRAVLESGTASAGTCTVATCYSIGRAWRQTRTEIYRAGVYAPWVSMMEEV
ncbi:hypothetical protein C8T65DRAFT_644074 [Cerioporus squamosus]|nr:hypothetical protein C8T65DRAFT_644074 [Cerioporus squamosus]